MAETAGLVQKLQILPGTGTTSYACAWIGATPSNTALLFVDRKDTDAEHIGAFKNSMADTLATAMVARREVIAIHGTSDSRITGLRIDPA